MNVDISALGTAVTSELEKYDQTVADGIKEKVREVANECKQDIVAASPRLSGSYAKGWATRVEYESDRDIRIRVYNKTDYQLTHLLEYGHKGPGGVVKGSAPAYPHITPAEKKTAAKLVNVAKVVLR